MRKVSDSLQQPRNEDISHDCRLFGNRANREIFPVDDEEKQDHTTTEVDYGSESPYKDTAITA